MIDEKKLIELLRLMRDKCCDRANKEKSINFARKSLDISHIIGIINNQPQIGEWIPCSERLPEEHESIFAKFKGTDKWNESMYEKVSGKVNVTVVDNKGLSAVTYAHTIDGQWSCDLLRCNKTFRIIAWMPFPEPYNPYKLAP